MSKFLRVSRSLIDDSNLTPAEMRLLLKIASYADYTTGDNCYPPQRAIAAHLGIGERTVNRYVARLEVKGYISIERTRQGNKYIILKGVVFCDTPELAQHDKNGVSNNPNTPELAYRDTPELAGAYKEDQEPIYQENKKPPNPLTGVIPPKGNSPPDFHPDQQKLHPTEPTEAAHEPASEPSRPRPTDPAMAGNPETPRPDKQKPRAKPRRAERMRPDWQPSREAAEYAAERGYSTEQTARIRNRFVDFFTSGNGRRATRVDWTSRWKTWIDDENPPTVAQPRQPAERPTSRTAQFYHDALARLEAEAEEERLEQSRASAVAEDHSPDHGHAEKLWSRPQPGYAYQGICGSVAGKILAH